MSAKSAQAGVLSLVVAILLIAPLSQLTASVLAARCEATGSQAHKVMRALEVVGGDAIDDSPSIQRLIDRAAMSGGAIVQLPAGVLDLDRYLVLRDNVELRGAGPDTILKASSRFLETKGPHGGHPLITTDGAANVTISRLTADQSGDVINGNVSGRLHEYLIDVRRSTNAVVREVTTKNPFTYSIAVVASRNFCLADNRTSVDSTGRYNQLDGIHITDSHAGLVVGNHVDQGLGEDGDDGLAVQTIGDSAYDVVFRDNEVRGGSHGSGMQFALGNHEIHNVAVTNNRFWGSTRGIQTGYYDGWAPLSHVVLSQNSFTDIAGPAVMFSGDLHDITVTDNTGCRSGGVNVDGAASSSISQPIDTC